MYAHTKLPPHACPVARPVPEQQPPPGRPSQLRTPLHGQLGSLSRLRLLPAPGADKASPLRLERAQRSQPLLVRRLRSPGRRAAPGRAPRPRASLRRRPQAPNGGRLGGPPPAAAFLGGESPPARPAARRSRGAARCRRGGRPGAPANEAAWLRGDGRGHANHAGGEGREGG